jgi:hypothetical protein
MLQLELKDLTTLGADLAALGFTTQELAQGCHARISAKLQKLFLT